MREILFRGKTLTGRWVEGSYYKQEEFYGSKEDADVIITSKENLTYDQVLDFAIVLPETVGQYTGLTDKNGKKIFEGDIIIKHSTIQYVDDKEHIVTINGIDEKGVVDFVHNSFGIFYNKRKGASSMGLFPNEWFEVIGNIHDNPELLKGE